MSKANHRAKSGLLLDAFDLFSRTNVETQRHVSDWLGWLPAPDIVV